MKDYKDYKKFRLVPDNDGFMQLAGEDKKFGFQDAWAVLNIYGALATSSISQSGIFLNKEKAKEYVTYLLEECDCRDCYVQEILLRGDEIQIPEKIELGLPEGEKAKKAAIAVLEAAVAVMGRCPYTGGCHTFYSPEEWKERKEEYGLNSHVLLVHDGGDFACLCNPDYEYYELYDMFLEELKKRGYYYEPCTCWYAAVYPVEK